MEEALRTDCGYCKDLQPPDYYTTCKSKFQRLPHKIYVNFAGAASCQRIGWMSAAATLAAAIGGRGRQFGRRAELIAKRRQKAPLCAHLSPLTNKL